MSFSRGKISEMWFEAHLGFGASRFGCYLFFQLRMPIPFLPLLAYGTNKLIILKYNCICNGSCLESCSWIAVRFKLWQFDVFVDKLPAGEA